MGSRKPLVCLIRSTDRRNTIKTQYWDRVVKYMEVFGMEAENTPNFWLGMQADGTVLEPEQATVVVIAWRTLYAADVYARLNEQNMNLDNAFFQMTRMVLSRVKAHGAKWRLWYVNQRLWQPSKTKIFPTKHRRNHLITFDETAQYVISEELVSQMKAAKNATTDT